MSERSKLQFRYNNKQNSNLTGNVILHQYIYKYIYVCVCVCVYLLQIQVAIQVIQLQYVLFSSAIYEYVTIVKV
jgi:hypothetical protein